MLKDLYLYEIVLLILGSLLFLILSGALVYYILKKEEIKKILFFFPIPILMIAYPSIKEISVSSERIELITYQERYENNPQDSVALEKIEKLTEELESRTSSQEDLIVLSKSNLLLDKPEKAITIADEILEKSSESEKEKNTYVIQAEQIKELASIQKKVLQGNDTVTTYKNFEELKLDPKLLKISAVLKKTTFRKTQKININ